VLLDIGLPDINGYEVARRIRALVGPGAGRIVALTGYGQPEDRRRALDAGFDEHCVKPIDPETLLKLLATDAGKANRSDGTDSAAAQAADSPGTDRSLA
jgi:two-component system CheB/CheR fusion protein